MPVITNENLNLGSKILIALGRLSLLKLDTMDFGGRRQTYCAPKLYMTLQKYLTYMNTFGNRLSCFKMNVICREISLSH